jgi:hypothetical protein
VAIVQLALVVMMLFVLFLLHWREGGQLGES